MSVPKIILSSLWILIAFFFSCTKEIPTVEVKGLFTLLPSEITGIKFENRLANETKFNVFKYRNYYNGGGVAIGDVNNDGLPDIYLTANHLPIKAIFNFVILHKKQVSPVSTNGPPVLPSLILMVISY